MKIIKPQEVTLELNMLLRLMQLQKEREKSSILCVVIDSHGYVP